MKSLSGVTTFTDGILSIENGSIDDILSLTAEKIKVNSNIQVQEHVISNQISPLAIGNSLNLNTTAPILYNGQEIRFQKSLNSRIFCGSGMLWGSALGNIGFHYNGNTQRMGINNLNNTALYTLDVNGDINTRTGMIRLNNTPLIDNGNTLGSNIINSSLTSVGQLNTLSVLNNTVLSGNLFVGGNLDIRGNIRDIDTETIITDAMSIINIGTAPSLVVNQKNTTAQPIAEFYDDDVCILRIGAEGVLSSNPTITNINSNISNINATLSGKQNLLTPSTDISVDDILCSNIQISSTITHGSTFPIIPNRKGATVLSSCETFGTEASLITVGNLTFTSNSNQSFNFSATSNNGNAFRAFGSSSGNWQSSSNYDFSDGTYIGGQSRIISGVSYSGERIQVQFPSAYKVFSMTISNLADVYGSYARNYVIGGSTDNTNWTLLHSGNFGNGTQTINFNNNTFSSLYLVLVIRTTDYNQFTDSTLSATLDSITFQAESSGITQCVYIPQSLEVGKTTTSTMPSNQLTVNGSFLCTGTVTTSSTMLYKNICTKVRTNIGNSTYAGSDNFSTFLNANGVVVDFNNTGGFGQGYDGSGYRAPKTGIYAISWYIRLGDQANNCGLQPQVNGSNLLAGDGTIWIPRDQANRRTLSYSTIVALSQNSTFRMIMEGNETIVNQEFSAFYISEQ